VLYSGVTTTGEVTQLPQGAAKRQGTLGGTLLVDGLFALHYRIHRNFLREKEVKEQAK